jgi:hypothetical protein
MSRVTAWVVVPVLAVLGLALLPGRALASDPPEWSEPSQVGVELPSSWFPDINVDPNGKARLVWSASLLEGDLNESHALAGAVMISELSETGWSEPADIFVMDGGIASRPMLASDGAWAHLIFRYAPPGAPVRLVYSRAPLGSDLSNTHSWSASRQLSNGESYWAQVVVLANSDVVVVYNQSIEMEVDGAPERRMALFVRRSTDNGETWSPPLRISNTTEHVARVSLAVGPDGQSMLAAWDVGYDNMSGDGDPDGLATSVSTDGGVTWSVPQGLAGGVEQSTVATNGTSALLVYRSTVEDQLYYKSSDDGGVTWSEQTPIEGVVTRPYPGKHNFDKLSLAVDGDGRFLLAWIGADASVPDRLSVMVASWEDGVWSSPTIVASPKGYPEYPRLTVSLGNQPEIVWFVRDNEFDVGSYTLWAAAGTSNAQAVAAAGIEPATVMESAPVVAPTPELFAWPTPQPAPVAETGVLVINRTPQAINAQPMRQIALVTTGGLLVLLVAIGAVRRLLTI